MSSLKDVSVGLVQTFEEAEAFMRWLGERRPVMGFDLETTGLDPYTNTSRIRLAQVGDAMTGWALPFERWGGLLTEAMNRYEGQIAIHNIAFEGKWMPTCAPDIPFNWSRSDDTMIMQRLDNPYLSAALKSMSKRIIGKDAGFGQDALEESMKANKWTWETVPIDLPAYWVYSAMDPVLTARIWEHFQKHATYPTHIYETEMQVRRICTQMEMNGFRVDLTYSDNKFGELSDYVESMKAWAAEEHGINIGSPRQLGKFFEDLGVDFASQGFTTPTGFAQINKASLKWLGAEGYLLAGEVLNTRKADKLAGTYFKNFLSYARDGLLHPNINTLAARTGRMSVTQPALQTLNKGDSTVRNAFIPRNENESILRADYEQIEMRLIAHFSGDSNLIAAFEEADNTGGDFFTVIGKQIYGPGFTKADKRRGLVKNVMYASGYGAGIPKIAVTAGVPLHVMEPIANSVFDTYPGIKGLQRTLIDRAIRSGMLSEDGTKTVTTPTGRRLIVEEGKEYSATNYMVQGHAAEILKRAIINLDNAGLGPYMVLPVHDEMVFSVPNDLIEEIKPVISECMTMTTEMGYKLQLPADPDGPYKRWGEPYE